MNCIFSCSCAVLKDKRTRVLDYTPEELEKIQGIHPTEWKEIMKEINQKEMEQIQNEHLKEEMKLQVDLEFHQSLMEAEKTQLMYRHEDRLEEIETEAAERIERLKESTREKAEEHKIEMRKKEAAHKIKIQMKKDELSELEKKASEKEEKYKEKFKKQEEFIQKREQEQDSDFNKQWDEQQKKFEEDAESLEAQLQQKQLQFDKKMEEGRIAMEKEFDSQIMTELKITSEDGSTLEIREKEPGMVTDLINTFTY